MRWFTRLLGRRPRLSGTPRRSRGFRPQVERLEAREVPTVNYYGGNLLPHVEAQALFLGNSWSNAPANATQTGSVNGFLTNLTGGAYMDALTRAGYGVGRGTASAGAVDNVAIANNTVLPDATIQSRLQADITSRLVQAPDANRLYVVYVEPNVAVKLAGNQGSTQHGVLGYHGAFAGRDAAGNPTTIRYAVIAYPGGTVNNSSLGVAALDQLTAVTSHELAEAVTDPDVNFSRLGWYDPQRGEIGDITENNPNALVRLNGSLVQEVADRNDQLLAVNALTPTPPPTPQVGTTTTLTAGTVTPGSRTRPATVTLTVTISPASGSAVPGGTVALVYGNIVLGTATVRVVNGVATATFTVAFYQAGNFTFTANYLGSSQFLASSSNALTVHV